jgi:hypothetical protein
MSGGQNRLPVSVKRERGTLRPGREPKPHPVRRSSRSLIPDPPDSLSKRERFAWLELRPQVQSLGVYAPSDFSSFRMLVKVQAMIDGAPKKMPPYALAQLIQRHAVLTARFGLSPADRGRVGGAVPEDEVSDPADEFKLDEGTLQ